MLNEDENLLAILGPTNTGKTYSAFEKLFSYSSGVFGFPLRLLARENYDKAVKRIGLSKKSFQKRQNIFFVLLSRCPIIFL